MGLAVSLLNKGLMLGGKALGSYAASWAGDEISKCLLNLVGYYSTEDRQKDEVKKWMQGVTAQLNILNSMIIDVSKQLSDGFNNISKQHYYDSYSDLYDKTSIHRANIDYAYNMLIEIMNNDYKNLKDIQIEILKLQKLTANITTSSTVVANAWGADKNIDKKNLLELWTDTCIITMGNDSSSLFFLYNNLEFNFQLGMISLFKAYSVLTTLKNYETETNPDEPDTKTSQWLANQVNTNLKPISDSFLECVERLILSSYRPDSLKNYYFGPVADIEAMGIRSQLCYFQTTNMDYEMISPGLIVKEYLRPSAFKNNKADLKIKAVGSGNEVILDGKRFMPPNKYCNGIAMSHWYKAVDKNAKGELLAFEDSDIITMNYSLPYSAEYSQSKSQQFDCYSNYNPNYATKTVAYKYYKPDTLIQVDAETNNAIPLAYTVIFKYLTDTSYEAFPISFPTSFPAQFEVDFSQEDQLKKHAMKNTVSVEGPYSDGRARIINIICEFYPDVFTKNHDFSFFTKYPIKYANQSVENKSIKTLTGYKGEKRGLNLVHDTILTVNVENYDGLNKNMRACDVGIDIFAKQNNTKINYFTHVYKSDTHLYNNSVNFEDKENLYYINNQVKNIDKDKIGITLSPGQQTVLHWEVKILLQTLTFSVDLLHTHYNYIQGRIDMKGRFSWDMPALS